MDSIYNELKETLSQDERLVSDGIILKNRVLELSLKYDKRLLELLIKNEVLKEYFFSKINNTLIFNKEKYIKFVSNKVFLPDSYTTFKNKIGLTKNEKYFRAEENILLAWPYKDCVLEGGQTKEEEVRNEVFHNEILAPEQIDYLLEPKVLTNFKRFNKDGEDENPNLNDNDNLIIKGNNLLVLHSLKNKFRNKVKLIYIDPPFNTGSDDFKYNDRFNHSSWLTFMKNRLEVAKELLSEEGVIFIHIDDKELYYLKVLCDEIFNENNFLNNIVVKTSDPSGHKVVNPSPYSQTEYILMYAKNKSHYEYDIHYVPSEYDTAYNKYIPNIDEHFSKWQIESIRDVVATNNKYETPRKAQDLIGKNAFNSLVGDFALKNKEQVFQSTAISNDAGKEIVETRDISKNNKDVVYCVEREDYDDVYILNGRQIYFYSNKVKEVEGENTPAKPLTNLWVDIPYNGISGEGNVTLKNAKKPEKLLKRIIEISTDKGDIVLDFFLGSGTTAAVAHKMGRQYIGVEQLDYGKNDSIVRLKHVIDGNDNGKILGWHGGGDFIYCELKKANQLYIDKIISTISDKDLIKVWTEMKENAFLSYKLDIEKFEDNITNFNDLSLDNKKQFLIECLDKNNLYVNLSEMRDITYNINNKDIELNKVFYKLDMEV
ncbi:MAG: DNA methyltransferase [bacterium]